MADSDIDGECAQCGALGRFGTCAELFHVLLALDHQRLQPWGRFHGINVACYFLQHPSGVAPAVLGGQWRLLTTFLDAGLDAVVRLEAEWVRSNRGRFTHDGGYPPPPPTLMRGDWTIEGVSLDGTFPAEGYEDRMSAWVHAIAAERGAGTAR